MEKIRKIIMFNDKNFYSLFYDIVYNDFIDRVKNRPELTLDEYYKIIHDMFEKLFPYLPVFMIENIIKDHGWGYCDLKGDGRLWYKKISKDE